jgi:hypothetical protein
LEVERAGGAANVASKSLQNIISEFKYLVVYVEIK